MRWFLPLICFLTFLPPSWGQEPDSATPDDVLPNATVSLLVAVRQPTQKLRAKVVTQLVKRRDISLDDWLAAMRDLNTADQLKPGTQTFQPELELDGKLIATELVIYVPETYQGEKATPLLLLLHGSGGDGHGMISQWRSFADSHGYLLCAPTAPDSGGGYAFTAKERDSGMEALRWMRAHFFIDSSRVHLHGVSRGGHMAWDLASRYPDHFATMVPAIGGPTWVINGGRNNMRLVENLWNTPIRDLQGSQDDTRLIRNLRSSLERIQAAGNKDAELIEFEDLGHSYRLDSVDWAEFFTGRTRDPLPNTLFYRTARKDNPRVFWMKVTQLEKGKEEIFAIRVDGEKWDTWDDQQKSDFIQSEADDRTAEISASRNAEGILVLTSTSVGKVELLIPSQWISAKGKVDVLIAGKSKALKATLSKKVLLSDFVDRLDRNFLPVAKISVKL
jgi:poly(3-hydroxybutyrate) depolymerase